jgi:hypothetical protein
MESARLKTPVSDTGLAANDWSAHSQVQILPSALTNYSQSSVRPLTFTEADYARARNNYRPDKIKTLFIAESPPSSGGYFYFSRTIGKDHLFRETMKALGLWPSKKKMGRGLDKGPMLDAFRQTGLFLIDTCDLPVDKLFAKNRKAAIRLGASRLASRVSELDPDHIIIIKKTIFLPVREALERENLARLILNRRAIPFPSHGNQERFRSAVRRLIRGKLARQRQSWTRTRSSLSTATGH